ncbi:MAG TPA: hypothetical protein VLB67_11000 [Acidimicrobiia bacterium]|nr:hypothetical protein [Acidimicrobiia bacterium]
MNTPREALETLLAAAEDGRLKDVCDRFGVELLTVFGSALDPNVDTPDDLDVAVRFGSGRAQDVLGAVTALGELLGFDDLDVMVLNGAGVVARSRALGPGSKGLYEGRRGARALAQMAAITEEMETAPMRRRDLQLLASR